MCSKRPLSRREADIALDRAYASGRAFRMYGKGNGNRREHRAYECRYCSVSAGEAMFHLTSQDNNNHARPNGRGDQLAADLAALAQECMQ